jgi:hypothetical protein
VREPLYAMLMAICVSREWTVKVKVKYVCRTRKAGRVLHIESRRYSILHDVRSMTAHDSESKITRVSERSILFLHGCLVDA